MSASLVLAEPGRWPWLIAAPAAFLLAWYVDTRIRRRAWRRAFGSEATLRAPVARLRARAALGLLGVMAAAAALTDPRVEGEGGGGRREGRMFLFLLDVSRSMEATDLEPDRLGAARRAIAEFALRAAGARFSLVVFAGNARVRCPPTTDVTAFVDIVARAGPSDVGLPGSEPAAAFEAARALLRSAGAGGAHVVLLSDGEDDSGRAQQAASNLGSPVHAVCFGSPLGAVAAPRVPEEKPLRTVARPDRLRALAEATGGAFVDARFEDHPLLGALGALLPSAAREAAAGNELALAPWLLWLCAACAASAWLLPRLRTGAGLAALLALAAGGCGDGAAVEARGALRDGRFDLALEGFAEAWGAPEEAPPSDAVQWAQAALAAGRTRLAVRAAEAAALAGPPELGAWRDRMLAAAFRLEAERAAAQARAVEAEPFAFDLALEAAAEAVAHLGRLWARGGTDAEWAESNLRHLLLKVEQWRREREEVRSRRRPRGAGGKASARAPSTGLEVRPEGRRDRREGPRALLRALEEEEARKRNLRRSALARLAGGKGG